MTKRSIEPDERGLVLTCPKCDQRNRLVYARLGQKFRCAQRHTELSSPSEAIEVKKECVFEALTGQSSLPVPGRFLGAMVRTVQNGRARSSQSCSRGTGSLDRGKGEHGRV